MAENIKVCLVTGVSGFIGQHILASLVATGHKVLALGDATEEFSPSILAEQNIKITTALPISSQSFKHNDVQYCFGDIADISFVASIFATAENRGIDIEFVLHLACCSDHKINKLKNAQINLNNYNGTANILETAHAYWQDHDNVLKGFFLASDYQNSTPEATDTAVKKLIHNVTDKDGFPTVIFNLAKVYGPGDNSNNHIVPGTLYRLLYNNPNNEIMRAYQGPYNFSGALYNDSLYIKNLTCAVNLLLDKISKDSNPDLIIGEEFNVSVATEYYLTYSKNQPTKEQLTRELRAKRKEYMRLNRAIGYIPQYGIESGFKETAQWYRLHKGK